MSFRRPLLLAVVFLSNACLPWSDGACPAGFSGEAAGCAFDEAAVLDLVTHMDDGQLVKVNAEPYMPVYSSTPMLRNVWVSPLNVPDSDLTADELYGTIDQDNWWEPMEDTFPVGTVIIHESVDRIEAHGVEVKRDDYADEMGRNWWLAMVNDDGTLDDGYREPCANCHNEGYRVTAGLWGVPEYAK